MTLLDAKHCRSELECGPSIDVSVSYVLRNFKRALGFLIHGFWADRKSSVLQLGSVDLAGLCRSANMVQNMVVVRILLTSTIERNALDLACNAGATP